MRKMLFIILAASLLFFGASDCQASFKKELKKLEGRVRQARDSALRHVNREEDSSSSSASAASIEDDGEILKTAYGQLKGVLIDLTESPELQVFKGLVRSKLDTAFSSPFFEDATGDRASGASLTYTVQVLNEAPWATIILQKKTPAVNYILCTKKEGYLFNTQEIHYT